jgi:hypothetical protein
MKIAMETVNDMAEGTVLIRTCTPTWIGTRGSYSSFQSDSNYVVSDGKWEPRMEQPGAAEEKWAALRLTLTPTPNDYVVAQFWIARENNALVLWQHIGDPDHSRYAVFHKEP